MLTLDQIARKHGTDKCSTCHNYCRTYEQYFGPIRAWPVRLLEIGVQTGASIKTWLEYFPHAFV